MNIVKSLHSSLLHKCFSYQGKHYFTVSVLWGFNLQTGIPVMEQDLWQCIGDMLGKNELFDAGMLKPNGEVLVHGSCFAPKGEAVNAHRVSVSLGSVTKELYVFGDRHWIKGLGVWGVSDPEPFTEMPVSYANAFGGKDNAANPLGKGLDEVEGEGDSGPQQPLPNIEYADQLIGSPSDKPRPAALNRIDMICEQRMSYAGTYDQKYIETRMPGFPDDFDYRYFNDAASDQHNSEYFKGDENYEIRNMHPEHAVIKGQIPGVYGRAFVSHKVNDEVLFKEVPTRLDTVWLFPDADLGVLIHRGTIEVNEDDAADIKQILIANENRQDTPRSVKHYKNELALRTDPEESFKYLMYTAPLIPEGMTCGFKVIQENADFPLELLAKSNMDTFADTKKREVDEQTNQQFEQMKQGLAEGSPERKKIDDVIQQLADAKVNPPKLSPEMQRIQALSDKILPGMAEDPKTPDITKLNLKAMDELKAHMEQLQKEKQAEAKQQLVEQLDELKKIQGAGEASPQVKQLENVLIQMDLPPMLPRIDVETILDQLKQQQSELQKQLVVMQSMGLPEEQLAKIQQATDIPQIEKQTRESLDKAKDGYRIGAHYIEQARSPHEGQEAAIREALIKAHRSGGKTANGDYAFVDLSGLDLSGIDLRGAYLEYADLTNTNLTNANLSKAILSHAVMNNTILTNANLTEANLGAINFEVTHFSDCDLTGATLGKSNISDTLFERCKMAEKMDMFLETTFVKARFGGSDMRKNTFIDADITGCDFSGADLSESNFINPIMKNSVFTSANLSGVNMIKAQADGSNFDKASMKNVRFVGESALENASFQFADVSEANLRDCNLRGANFSQANIHKSDFGGANLHSANFEKAYAVSTQFNKADLTFANMENINMMEGSLYKAVISGAHFNNASLYNVNFLGCTVGKTDFTGADLEQTIFKDWRPS